MSIQDDSSKATTKGSTPAPDTIPEDDADEQSPEIEASLAGKRQKAPRVLASDAKPGEYNGKACMLVPLSGKYGFGKHAPVSFSAWALLEREGWTNRPWPLDRGKSYDTIRCTQGGKQYIVAAVILGLSRGHPLNSNTEEARYHDTSHEGRLNLLESNLWVKTRKPRKTKPRVPHRKPGAWQRFTDPTDAGELVSKELSGIRGGTATIDWPDFDEWCLQLMGPDGERISDVRWTRASHGRSGGSIYAKAGGLDICIARVLMNAGPGQAVRYKDGNPTNLRRSNLELVKGGGKFDDRTRLLSWQPKIEG